MTTTENSLLGRPIHGDINNYTYRTPVVQKGPEEFLEVLDTFFAKYPQVSFVRWAQGTPGFNDGDPCVFEIHEARLGFGNPDRDAWSDDEEEEYSDTDHGDNSYSGSDLYSYDWNTPSELGRYSRIFDKSAEGHPITEELYKDYEVVNKAIQGGEFEEVVHKTFGDPSEITATRDGFNVEYYDVGH